MKPPSSGHRPTLARPGAPTGPKHGGKDAPTGGVARPAAPGRADSFRAAPRPGSGGGGGPPRGGRQDTPSGTIWIYGIHPVAAALANPARRLRRLVVTEDAEKTLAEHVRPPFSVPPERIARDRLDQMLGRDVVHQGVALLADPLPQPPLAQILERGGPLLVLDQVTDPRNVGAILRSAAAFGVAGVITQDRNAPEETGALAKAASGALEIVPMIRAVNLARTLVALKAANVWCVGLAADAAPLRGAPLAERRVALVLGAEGAGLRRLTRDTCDELAGLAMPGTMESLNVSAAATVALYELTRK
jgi:23S rRNA (guanosine2251-2'-O)-methyltransferase